MLSVTQDTWHRMMLIGMERTGKQVDGNGRGRICDTVPIICLIEQGKPSRFSDRIFGYSWVETFLTTAFF